ncbi:hypothetical protein L218DRAFT_999872 [Marasmius fiardii PR-910]|nr:hypothetical protein L218DRAFT_999872 [Marasmius fiardii PR-910]
MKIFTFPFSESAAFGNPSTRDIDQGVKLAQRWPSFLIRDMPGCIHFHNTNKTVVLSPPLCTGVLFRLPVNPPTTMVLHTGGHIQIQPSSDPQVIRPLTPPQPSIIVRFDDGTFHRSLIPYLSMESIHLTSPRGGFSLRLAPEGDKPQPRMLCCPISIARGCYDLMDE